ncbi:hypothetical protein ATB96_06200 [Elizabethkingia ursingii]|nr:hypothetical protein ATB96_06200 [Elizabethkingia ursingii]
MGTSCIESGFIATSYTNRRDCAHKETVMRVRHNKNIFFILRKNLCRFDDVSCKKLKLSILVIDKYMMDGFEFGIICLNFAI